RKRSPSGQPSRTQRSSPGKRATFRPRLEGLEDRWLPSTLTVLNTLDSGPGSLRAAIAVASSGDTINFANSLKGQTITLTSGQLAITTNLDIEGLGANKLAVSGTGVSRVFDIAGGANATIAGLAIINGRAGEGAGIFNEPGARLIVTDCAFQGNLAVGGSFGLGGGILNEGSATVSGSTFDGNQATGGDGGVGAGGGISNIFSATLTVSNSTFTNNLAIDGQGFLGTGGAIANGFGSSLTLSNSTFTSNEARGNSSESSGGALGNIFATISVSNCNFTNNLSAGFFLAGSGAFDNAFGAATISNSTFTNNRAIGTGPGAGASGGGLSSVHDSILTMTNTTFTGNQALGGAAGASGDGGLAEAGAFISGVNSTATVTNSSFIGNQAIGGAGGAGGAGGVGQGGGIINFTFVGSGPGTMTLSSCTVSRHHAICRSRRTPPLPPPLP